MANSNTSDIAHFDGQVTWVDDWAQKSHIYILPYAFIEGTVSSFDKVFITINTPSLSKPFEITVPTFKHKTGETRFRYNITNEVLSSMDQFMKKNNPIGPLSSLYRSISPLVTIAVKTSANGPFSESRIFNAIIGSSPYIPKEKIIYCDIVNELWYASLFSNAGERYSKIRVEYSNKPSTTHSLSSDGKESFLACIDTKENITSISYQLSGMSGEYEWVKFIPIENNTGHTLRYYDSNKATYDTITSEEFHLQNISTSDNGYFSSRFNNQICASIGRDGEEFYILKFRGKIYDKLKMLLTSQDVAIMSGRDWKRCAVSGKVATDSTGYVNTDIEVKVNNIPTLKLRK